MINPYPRIKRDDSEKLFCALMQVLSVADIQWLQQHYPQWVGFQQGIPIGAIKEKRRLGGRRVEVFRSSSDFDWIEASLGNEYDLVSRIKEMIEAKMRTKVPGGKSFWLSKVYLLKIAEALHLKAPTGEPFTPKHSKEVISQTVLSYCDGLNL